MTEPKGDIWSLAFEVSTALTGGGIPAVLTWATEPRGQETLQILTPTDSVRDRLCAFYFWRDISALVPAIEIAMRQDVDLGLVADWSRREGESERFEEFSRRLQARRDAP